MLSPTTSEKHCFVKKLMHNESKHLSTLPNEIVNSEGFSEIIEAIIGGKYSWACVLLLRWSSYHPTDYIPYRTYMRLVRKYKSRVLHSR